MDSLAPALPTTPTYRHTRTKAVLSALAVPVFGLLNRPSLWWLAEAAYDVALRWNGFAIGFKSTAGKPVASEDMTLLMKAGKPVVFEPAITAELARLGRWDEVPLISMIRTGGFAFMLTAGDEQGGNDIRTATVDAAMREAYPHVEQVSRRLWLHAPSGS